MAEVARDLFGQAVELNDLVVYGHSGRSASTRVGRVYWVRGKRVRVRIFERTTHFDHERKREVYSGGWTQGGTADPNGFVRVDPLTAVELPPLLDEKQLKR